MKYRFIVFNREGMEFEFDGIDEYEFTEGFLFLINLEDCSTQALNAAYITAVSIEWYEEVSDEELEEAASAE